MRSLWITAVVIWILLLPRICPDDTSDRGIFVSVAERLRAGDRLYSGVFDNKDPLFYYFVEGQRALGWGAEVAAEFLLIMLACISLYAILRVHFQKWISAAISFVAAPIVLTGTYYYPGYTELLGIALVLGSLGAAFCRRPLFTGIGIGILLFAKLIYLPVIGVGIACLVVARRSWADFVWIAVSASITALAIAAVLAARGELWPLLETMRLNIAYSQGALLGNRTGISALAQHLKLAGGPELQSQLVSLALLNVILLMQRSAFAIISIGLSFACVAVLAVTGLWDQHGQILYIPALVGLAALAPLSDLAKQRLLGLLTIILCAFLLGGASSIKHYLVSVRNFRMVVARAGTISPEARALLAVGSTGIYARLGRNDDMGHAKGLQQWKLACPRFHQYPFLSKEILKGVLDCATTAPTLIVSETLDQVPDRIDWNDFVSEAKALLKDYNCDSHDGFRICRRPG